MSLGSASLLAEAYQETHEEGALAENLGHVEFYFHWFVLNSLNGSWKVSPFENESGAFLAFSLSVDLHVYP